MPGRRKPFIVAAAVGCGTAAAILVVSPTWPAALVAAPLLGAGFGTYWAGRRDSYPGPFGPLTTITGPGRDIYAERPVV